MSEKGRTLHYILLISGCQNLPFLLRFEMMHVIISNGINCILTKRDRVPPFRCQSKNGKCLKNQPWLRFPLCLSIIFVFCLIFQQLSGMIRLQSSQDVAFCMAAQPEYQDDAKVHNHKSWKFNAERMTITQRFFNQMIVMFGRFIHAKLLRQSSLDTLG